jgi:hypothetical protein
MQYVVIEYFGEPELVKDEEGKVKQFDNVSEATDEARECQNGIVVPLSTTLMNTINEASTTVDSCISDVADPTDVQLELWRLLGE